MNLEVFDKYVEEKILNRVESDCGNLVLFNYTDKCTFDKAWDDVTLNARGTVYEKDTGKVVAKAFPKFFNFGELDLDKQQEILNSKSFDVYEKMDGSLGIIYNYKGQWRVNTRGSFSSDQAIKAQKLLKNYDLSKLYPTTTLLVEIIYPENRIIVDYKDEEKLVLLAAYNHVADMEILPLNCPQLASTNLPVAPKYNFSSIESLQTHLETLGYDEEGYVVRLDSGYRVKFKSAEYLRLARILSNMSPLAFWEKMEKGRIDREFLEQLPEEFRDECDEMATKLEQQYIEVYREILDETKIAIFSMTTEETKKFDKFKQLGLYLKSSSMKHTGAIFCVVRENNEGLEKYIMRYIRPKANQMVEL